MERFPKERSWGWNIAEVMKTWNERWGKKWECGIMQMKDEAMEGSEVIQNDREWNGGRGVRLPLPSSLLPLLG